MQRVEVIGTLAENVVVEFIGFKQIALLVETQGIGQKTGEGVGGCS